MLSLKQSVAFWCFANAFEPEELFAVLAEIGYRGVEMVPAEHRGLARAAGLEVINHNCGQIEVGLNKRAHHDALIPLHQAGIDANAVDGIRDLIVFCGNRDGKTDEDGLASTIEGFRPLAPYAKERGVVLMLELFNQKNHPDYMGDNTRFGLEVCRAVNSSHMKLLYDVYHMALQEQNLIRDMVDHLEWIQHVHLASAAARNCTADAVQIPYPEIVRAVHGAGYAGYWGQEFVPGADVRDELRRAFDYMNDSL